MKLNIRNLVSKAATGLNAAADAANDFGTWKDRAVEQLTRIADAAEAFTKKK